jgi:hypothetical protein
LYVPAAQGWQYVLLYGVNPAGQDCPTAGSSGPDDTLQELVGKVMTPVSLPSQFTVESGQSLQQNAITSVNWQLCNPQPLKLQSDSNASVPEHSKSSKNILLCAMPAFAFF